MSRKEIWKPVKCQGCGKECSKLLIREGDPWADIEISCRKCLDEMEKR